MSEINIRYIKIKPAPRKRSRLTVYILYFRLKIITGLYFQVYGLVYVTLSDFIIIILFKFSEFLQHDNKHYSYNPIANILTIRPHRNVKPQIKVHKIVLFYILKNK